MLPSFYILATYRFKAPDDTITREIKSGLYVDNYHWDEVGKMLVFANNKFDHITSLYIENAKGEVLVEFSDKLQVELLK